MRRREEGEKRGATSVKDGKQNKSREEVRKKGSGESKKWRRQMELRTCGEEKKEEGEDVRR